jgi:hypothetical protein
LLIRRLQTSASAPEENIVPNRPLFQPVALAGAVAISASLIGFAALPQALAPPTQTRAVQLTSGESELIAPFDGAAQADGYSFADLITAVQNTVSHGEGWFTSAETAFSHGEYPLALSEELAGFNNLTVGVGNDFLTDGYAVLTGVGGNSGFILVNPGQPVDFAAALNDVHTFSVEVQTDLTNALSAFASGDGYLAALDLSSVNIDSTNATDAVILGLFDSLTGAPETAAAVPAASLSFADLLSSVEGNISAGDNLLGLAETAFTNGDYSVGLADALAGFDNLTVGAGSELLINGYAFLTGDGGNAALILETVPRPSDFAVGLTEAQGFLDQAQPFFGAFITDLAAGNGYAGLADLTGIGIDSSYATDAIILGLFDSLPGVPISL